MLFGSVFLVELSEFSGEDLTAKDSSGTSDPFLKIYFGKHPVVTSPTIKANLNPVWKAFSTAFEYKVENTERMNKEYLRITCFDADYFSSEVIGECKVDLETLAAGPRKQELTLHSSSGMKQGTLRFTALMHEIRDINVRINEVSLGVPFSAFTDEVGSADNTFLKISYPSATGKEEQVASVALYGGFDVPPVFNGIPDFVMRMDVPSFLKAKVSFSIEKERKAGSIFSAELSLYDLMSFDASEQSYTRDGRSKTGVIVPVSARGVISNVPKFSQMEVGVHHDGVLKGARPIHFRARVPRDAKFDPPLEESKDGSRPSMPSRPSSPVVAAAPSPAGKPSSPSSPIVAAAPIRTSEPTLTERKSADPVRSSVETAAAGFAIAAVAVAAAAVPERVSVPSPYVAPPSPVEYPSVPVVAPIAAAVAAATPSRISHPAETVYSEPARTSYPTPVTPVEAGRSSAPHPTSSLSPPPFTGDTDLPPPDYDEDDAPSAPPETTPAPKPVVVAKPVETPKPEESRSGKKLPEGFEAKHDPKSGKTVYIDHFLKTTSWNAPRSLPDGFERATAGGKVFYVDHYLKKTQWDAPDPLPEGFQRMHDKSKDKIFYVDHFLKATSWTAPKALPLGWERAVDGKGRVFYINHEKKATQWDAPV